MKTKQYTVTKRCYSLQESEKIRDEVHQEFVMEFCNRNIPITAITSQVLFDYLNFECIVKIIVKY